MQLRLQQFLFCAYSLATFSLSAAQATTTVLQSSVNPGQTGQPLTLTAAVTPSSATGKVTFYDGAAVLGIAPVNAGSAAFTTKLLSGTHPLTARYDGNSGDAASVSTVVSEVIHAIPANTFIALPGFGTTGGYAGLAADFNGDGILDLVVLEPNGETAIFLGNGDGTFTPGATYGLNASFVVASDFNEDGKTDLAFASQQTSVLSILLGNGDGTFQSPTTITLPMNGYASAGPFGTADFNGDGNPDLIVLLGQDVYFLPGNGDGTFGSAIATAIPSGSIIQAFGVGDFNGDGKVDFISNSWQSYPYFFAGSTSRSRMGIAAM